MQTIKQFYYDKRYHKTCVFLIVQALFIGLILLITGIIMTKSLSTYVTSFDSADHLQEAQEIAYDIAHLKWPSFIYSYGIPGDAMTTYYPWLGFLGFIISDLFKCPMIIGIKVMFFLSFYVMFNVIYYAALSYWHNKKESILFTIFNIITPLYIGMFDTQKDYAQALGLSFLILIIFGWLHWAKDNHWQMLAIGLTLLMYTNFVLIYMSVLVLGLATILMPRLVLNKKHVVSALKAASTTIIATMAIWLPLIILSSTNQIDIPLKLFVADNNLSRVYFYYMMPVTNIIIILAMVCYYTRLTYMARRILITITIGLLFFYKVIPLQWQAMMPIKSIQLVWRIIAILQPLLLVVWVPVICKCLHRKDTLRTLKTFVYSYLIFFGLISVVLLLLNTFINQNSLTKPPETGKVSMGRLAMANFKGFNNGQKSTIFRGRFYIGEYLPCDVIQQNNKEPKHLKNTDFKYSYLPDLYFQRYYQRHHIEFINNGIEFTQRHPQNNVRLPLVLYHGQDYQIYDNGQQVQRYSHRCHELVLLHVDKGTHRVTFDAPVMWYRYFATIVSTGCVLIWAIIDLKKRKDRL